MLTRSISAIRFGVILGGTLLALSILSLRSWKGGESSTCNLKDQAAIALVIFIRELRFLSREFNFDIEGRAPLQTHGDFISSPCNRSYKQAERASYVAADRFRSRWLSGWVRKDVEVKIPEVWNNYKIVPNIREISFLLESVDVIKDENSVHKLEVGSSTQGLHRNIERTILHKILWDLLTSPW